MDWEKIFENDVTDKDLLPKYTSGSYNSVTTTKNNPIEN